MIDILGHINLSRSGDLITADTSFCYLFLNACPQTVLLATLERLLGMSVDAAFDTVRFLVARVEIEPELSALSRAAERGDLPDYSALSEATQPPELPSTGKFEATPLFAPTLPSAPITSTAPITELPSELTAGEQQTRELPGRPMPATAAKSPIAPQVKPGLSTAPAFGPPDDSAADRTPHHYSTPQAPVFGKKEVPWATRSAPPVVSTDESKGKV